MTEKRFVDDGFEAIDEQSFTDTKTDKTYYVDYFDEIIDLANELAEEKEYYQIKSGKCEEELLKLRRDNEQLIQENKELKDKNNQLQETLAFRSNQLALMERLVDDLGSEEMARQMEEILE